MNRRALELECQRILDGADSFRLVNPREAARLEHVTQHIEKSLVRLKRMEDALRSISSNCYEAGYAQDLAKEALE